MNARGIKILGSIILIIIVILGAVFVVSPLIGAATDSPEIREAKGQNQQLQQQLQQLQGVQGQVAQLTSIKNSLDQRYPSAANVPDLITLISASAVKAGIPATNITNFGFSAPQLGAAASGAPAGAGAPAASAAPAASSTPAASGAPTTTGASAGTAAGTTSQYASLGVTLSVSGTSAQFAQFMQYLTSMRRVFTIDNFSITVGTGNASTLNVTGKTYLYKSVPQPNASASTQAQGTTTNGQQGTTTNGNTTTSTVAP